MKKNLTELVFILDKSGSMSGLEKDTIGGFNSLLDQQRKVDGECVITTVLFDNRYELLHDRIDIRAVQCVRRCKTTPRPSKSDTLTAEIRHSFRWSDSWYFRVETGLYVGPHAVWLSP